MLLVARFAGGAMGWGGGLFLVGRVFAGGGGVYLAAFACGLNGTDHRALAAGGVNEHGIVGIEHHDLPFYIVAYFELRTIALGNDLILYAFRGFLIAGAGREYTCKQAQDSKLE